MSSLDKIVTFYLKSIYNNNWLRNWATIHPIGYKRNIIKYRKSKSASFQFWGKVKRDCRLLQIIIHSMQEKQREIYAYQFRKKSGRAWKSQIEQKQKYDKLKRKGDL